MKSCYVEKGVKMPSSTSAARHPLAGILLHLLLILWVTPAYSALAPEAYEKALASFRHSTDTKLELKFIRSKKKRSNVGVCQYRKCDCTDTYKIISISTTPVSHPIHVGDTMYFSYTCSLYLESTFPWSSMKPNGNELLAVPSRFIVQDKARIWHLTGPFRPSRPYIKTPLRAMVVKSPILIEGFCRHPGAKMSIDISDRYGRSLAHTITTCRQESADSGGVFREPLDVASPETVSGRIIVSELLYGKKSSGFSDNTAVFFRNALFKTTGDILKLLSKEDVSLLRKRASSNLETIVHDEEKIFHGTDLTWKSLRPLTEWAKRHFYRKIITPYDFEIIKDRHGNDFVTLELEREGQYFYISWDIGENKITKVIASDQCIAFD